MRRATLYILSALVLAVLVAFAAFAEDAPNDEDLRGLYQWTDDRGVVHITDTLQNVPPRYRPGAKRIETQPPAGGPEPQVAPPYERSDERFQESGDESQEEEWRERMREARRRLAEAERRSREVEEEYNALREKWGYGAYGYTPDVEARLIQLEKDLQEARKQVEAAKERVEVVIPEQARKAGVPPGWLRE